ncbi:unnamed protein product [Ilex paraguariensis]|uniref:H15 domain-containing protein n=1 Tax=Ilex paraguariensis TaxID=185542 RepID=A0ABC8SKZ9_9AQUA
MDPKPPSSPETMSQSQSQNPSSYPCNSIDTTHPSPNTPTRTPNLTTTTMHDQIHNRAMDNFRALVMQFATASNPTKPLSPALTSLIEERLNHFFPNLHIPNHPPYPAMIKTAIGQLNEEGGSSEEAISELIQKEYNDLPWAHVTLLRHHLGKLCESGGVVVTSDKCFLLRDAITSSIPSPSSDSSFNSSDSLDYNPSISSSHSSSPSPSFSPNHERKRRREQGRGRGRPRKKNVRGGKIQMKQRQEEGRGRGRPPKRNMRGGKIQLMQRRGQGRGRGRPRKNYAREEDIHFNDEQMEVAQIEDQVELIEVIVEENQDGVIVEQSQPKEMKAELIEEQNQAQGQHEGIEKQNKTQWTRACKSESPEQEDILNKEWNERQRLVLTEQQNLSAEQEDDMDEDQNQQKKYAEVSEEQNKPLKQQNGVTCKQDQQQEHKVEVTEHAGQHEQSETSEKKDQQEEKQSNSIQVKNPLGNPDEFRTEALQSFDDGANSIRDNLMVLSNESPGSIMQEGNKVETKGEQHTERPCGEWKMFDICGRQAKQPQQPELPSRESYPEMKPMEGLSWAQEEVELHHPPKPESRP